MEHQDHDLHGRQMQDQGCQGMDDGQPHPVDAL